MVERRVCSFCGNEIEPGTGRMYIKKDGVIYNFCTSKCFKNLVELGRVPRRTTWTVWYSREKQVRMKGLPAAEETGAKARKLKKAPAEKEEASAAGKPEEKAEEKPAPAAEEKPKAEKKPAAKKSEKKDAAKAKPEAAKE
jgi:large subunit ribosomal protein L24e